MIRPLIERGAEIDEVDFLRRTPLHYVARNGMSIVVKELIDAGASLSVKDCRTRTPRDLANRRSTILVFEGEDPPRFSPFIYYIIAD